MKPVGYLVNTSGSQTGEPGLYYDYILAGNGLFVHAINPLVEATVCVAEAEVRGLAPLQEAVKLPRGMIPQPFYDLAISALAADPDHEHFLAITWDGEYHLRVPFQEGTFGGVTYERLPNTVLDVHSHGKMGAFFSWTDDHDEQRLGLYMVVGKLDSLWPDVELRVGAYGYFAPIQIEEVFDARSDIAHPQTM